MTAEEMVEKIDRALDFVSSCGVGVDVRLQALPYDVFETYADRYDGELEMTKCACGNCGKIVVAFEAALADSTRRVDGDDEQVGVFALFVRQATDEETVEVLERMVEA